jgi:hypothetical protein
MDASCQVKHVLYITLAPIPVAAPSKAWVCDGSVAGISDSNLPGGKDVSFCCERYILSGKVSASG